MTTATPGTGTTGLALSTRDAWVGAGRERPALRGVTLRINAGERVAVIGPSGAGKTTLLRLLGADLHPDRGSVDCGGATPASLEPRELRGLRQRIGFVAQDPALVPTLRASQNVLAGALGARGPWGALRLLLAPRKEDVLQAHALLSALGIGELLFQRTNTLSGGEAQRVAIARALFQAPQALLLDEPVAALDEERAREVTRWLLERAGAQGTTLVASLHHTDLALGHFDRVIGLRAGAVVLDAPAERVDPAELARLFDLGAAGA